MKSMPKILLAVLSVVVLTVGTLMLTRNSSECTESYPNGECLPKGMCLTSKDGVESCDYVDAIREAEEFESSFVGNCLSVETPATHRETGAKYTFSSSCIPDDWDSDKL